MCGSICHFRTGRCRRARKMHGSEKSRRIVVVSGGQKKEHGQNLEM